MSPHRIYYLRTYRKRSRLTQSDIAFLLGLPEHTSVSHWEKGRRTPHVEVILFYHLLFEIPPDSLFHGHEKLLQVIIQRTKLLRNELKLLSPAPKNAGRISFLDSTLKRLAPSQTL